MQTGKSIRTIINEVVFSPVSNAVNDFGEGEDEVWFTFFSNIEEEENYIDNLNLIQHIYANPRA